MTNACDWMCKRLLYEMNVSNSKELFLLVPGEIQKQFCIERKNNMLPVCTLKSKIDIPACVSGSEGNTIVGLDWKD